MKVLIAEDDKKLNEGIKLALKNDTLEFLQAFNYRDALKAIGQMPELVILDVNFPDGSGLELLKHIRGQKLPVRIIMITANNMESDIVTGLELGADDYITKPFSLMVLRARVNVQLRSLMGSVAGGRICIDDFVFDFERMHFEAFGRAFELSKTEQRLLKLLIENRGRTVSRESLIDNVWSGEAEYVDEHALTVTVKRLRDKLERDSSRPEYIRTVYGLGYTWAVK